MHSLNPEKKNVIPQKEKNVDNKATLIDVYTNGSGFYQ